MSPRVAGETIIRRLVPIVKQNEQGTTRGTENERDGNSIDEI